MKNFKILMINAFVIFSLTACTTTGSSHPEMIPLTSPKPVQTGRLLIKSAALEIEVDTPKETVSIIEAVVKR